MAAHWFRIASVTSRGNWGNSPAPFTLIAQQRHASANNDRPICAPTRMAQSILNNIKLTTLSWCRRACDARVSRLSLGCVETRQSLQFVNCIHTMANGVHRNTIVLVVRARFVLRPQTMPEKFLMKLKHKRFSHEKLCLAHFCSYCWLVAVTVPMVAPQSTTLTHTAIISYDKLFFALAHTRTNTPNSFSFVFYLLFMCKPN